MFDPRSLLPRDLHTTDRASLTAQVVTLWRAEELARPADERIVSDEYAPLFLTGRAASALPRLNRLRPLLDVTRRFELGGLSTYVLCRHRFIDEHLLAALDDGVEQVLVLGAGFDSRAYRFADELAGRPVFEVDLPALSRRKAAVVAANPDAFGHASVHRVEVDFQRQVLRTELDLAGFARGRRTFVVWEGVVPYLDRPAVLGTLDDLLGLTGPGSVIALDMWDPSGGAGPLAAVRRIGAAALELIGEPVRYGERPDDAIALVRRQGFSVLDLAGAAELDRRFATARRRCFEGLYVLAIRR